MAIVVDTIKKQVIALLNLNERNIAGVPSYTTTVADKAYTSEEIDQAIHEAGMMVGKTICETDGHPSRTVFITPQAVAHRAYLPEHFGTFGIPDILPAIGATVILKGKLKTVQEIQSYRNNVDDLYADTDHNVLTVENDISPLAGFYQVVDNRVHFTGETCTFPLAHCDITNYQLMDDAHEATVVAMSISLLNKDGNTTDIFNYYAGVSQQGLADIRNGGTNPPSIKPSVGLRQKGDK